MQLNESVEEICSRWNLPKNYVEFLNNHKDNFYASMKDEEENKEEEEDAFFFYESLIEVYGSAGFIIGQHGYSYNPVKETVIEEWNPNYVVIANRSADPYCIDITLDNSPVFYAMHGIGKWEFTKESESLEEFFDDLGI